MSTPHDTRDTPGGPALHSAFDLWDRHVRAFVALSQEAGAGGSGPLAGVTVGVKDVIDVAGMPTRNGSAACADAPPAAHDAPVVARLRAQGAAIVGKTVTTEFAYTDPTGCRNPYAPDRSPGGSSSGSGAAVGAGMVDIALGTQTAGSLCRPAAYCGAVGFKPGYGVLPTQGVTPLSPSHDTVGIIARSVDLARRAFVAMRATDAPPDTPMPGDTPRCGAIVLDDTARASTDVRGAFDAGRAALARIAGTVPMVPSLPGTQAIVADHRTVMDAECAINHPELLTDLILPLLGPNIRGALRDGAATPDAVRRAAADRLDAARAAFWDAHTDRSVLLTMPVPDSAPRLGGSTGFQHWLTVWTVLGGPLLCLPWGLDRDGLPLSVMLAGRPGEDARLLDLGARLAALAPAMPAPRLPAWG